MNDMLSKRRALQSVPAGKLANGIVGHLLGLAKVRALISIY